MGKVWEKDMGKKRNLSWVCAFIRPNLKIFYIIIALPVYECYNELSRVRG